MIGKVDTAEKRIIETGKDKGHLRTGQEGNRGITLLLL